MSDTVFAGEETALELLKGMNLTVRPDGQRLRRLRGVLRQRQVEESCGLGLNQLTRFENGLPGNVYWLAVLGNFYKVSPASLVEPDSLQELLAKTGCVLQLFAEPGDGSESAPASVRQPALQLS